MFATYPILSAAALAFAEMAPVVNIHPFLMLLFNPSPWAS